jgi:ankyrin repeat protein
MLIENLKDILFAEKYDDLARVLSSEESAECSFEIFKEIIDSYDEKALKILLESKLDINCRSTSYGTTPLLYAALHADKSVIRKLLNHGADLFTKDIRGDSTLIKAAKHNNVDAIQLFAKNGLDINEANFYGYTPLICAAMNESVEAVEILIKLGADFTRKSLIGDTALTAASECKQEFSMVEKLISAGANPNDYEYEYGRSPLSNLLRDATCPIEVIDLLINKGADVNYSDKGGTTPLFIAVFLGRYEAVKLLLAAGARIQVPNPLGIPLTELSMKLEYQDIANLLCASE